MCCLVCLLFLSVPEFGCDPLLWNALESLPECQREDQINALELLGTAFLFKEKSSISEAYHYFEKALQERYHCKKRLVSMTSLITRTAECQTLNELKKLRMASLR